MQKLNFIISFVALFLLISCKNDSKNENPIEIPLNNIHVNILSWDKELTQVDGLYYKEDRKYTGELNNNLLNNRIKASAQFRDGLLHGSFIETYADGQQRTRKNFNNGYEVGEQKGWHSNGQISYTYIADAGIRQGVYQEYYPNGKLQVESYYENGKEIRRKIKDLNGDIIVNYEIRDGRYYGLLGSSSCISVFEDEKYIKSNEN